ncbi:MAG TPA: hypothetical protein VK892_01370, partial [Pyrinomonadaceae bacterium]|nr:hypothetical protein [Pyrinomonadaceae bacterium]
MMFNIKYFLVLLVCLTTSVINIQANAGDLDPTFGANGKIFGTMSNTEAAQDAALQADGKIVLASATIGADSSADFAVIRLNANGTTDTSFGTNGKAVVSFDNFANERASAVVVQPDGKI